MAPPPATSTSKVPSGKRTVQLKKKLKRKQTGPRTAKTLNDTKKPSTSTPKLDEKLRELVEEHHNFVSENSDRIHQKVVKYMETHTVAQLCETVKAGMPDFWKAQIENDEVNLDELAARLLIDTQLQTKSSKRGTYLSLGRPSTTTQTSLAFPSSVVTGTRSSTRGRNAKRKWALYAGKSASWSGATQSRAWSHSVGGTKAEGVYFYDVMTKENLDNLTMVFWEAEDDALMEEFTIIESLMITRFGLFSDDNASKRAFRAMNTYGILAVNHEFFACNDKTAINDVQGTVLDLDVVQARGRNQSYRRHAGVERLEELEVLRLAKLTANNEDRNCPACTHDMGPGSWAFHLPTRQWPCVRCHKRAVRNNDVVVPIDSKRPRRHRDAADLEVQKVCGVNWCPKEIWVKGDKMDRKWIEELEAFVCTSHVNLNLGGLLETRLVRNKCGGYDYTSSNVQLNTFWDPRTQRWLCRTCKDGRPTRPAVCQISWCSRPA